MYAFSEIIKKELNDYKTILRRNLSSEERAAKLKALGLKRQAIQQADDAALYAKAQQVLEDIAQSIEIPEDDNNNASSWYCGLHAFYKHLRGILATHVTRQSS